MLFLLTCGTGLVLSQQHDVEEVNLPIWALQRVRDFHIEVVGLQSSRVM